MSALARPVDASGYDTHQGVDSCDVPTTTELQNLWADHPLFDYGFYIGGAEASSAGCAAWTSTKLATARSIGWGFTPIWEDLQAPTGCGPVINGTRHDYAERMSSNTTTAHNQGVTSGNSAMAAMTADGFGIADSVWLDIEAYDYSKTGCKAAVNAYVDGWSQATGVDGGVYGSAVSSQVDSWWSLSHQPFAVWIAAWDAPSSNPNTVWGISGVSNSHG
jgi:Rv2525c-like, glycoside hydrolase-like domain